MVRYSILKILELNLNNSDKMKTRLSIFCLLAVLCSSVLGKTDGRDSTLFCAREGDRWGYIDRNGNWIIEPRYDDVQNFNEDGIAEVSIRPRWFYIDRTGKKIEKPKYCEYELVENFSNGLAPFENNSGKRGYVNKSGKVVIKPRFCVVGNFSTNGLAPVTLIKNKPLRISFKKRHNECKSCLRRMSKACYIDRTGTIVIEPKFDDAGSFSDNGLAWACLNERFGYIDKTGNFVIEPRFYDACDFEQDGWACVCFDGKWGFIDRTGKFVIEPKFGAVESFAENGLAHVSSVLGVGDHGFIDRTGNYVIEPKYLLAESFSNIGLAPVYVDYKWGCIDSSGKLVIEPQYDELKIARGVIFVQLNEKWGIVDKTGKIIVEPKFSDIHP